VAAVRTRRAEIATVIRAASGFFLEIYDYNIYLYYAIPIGAAFFPANNAFVSLMLSLVSFGIAAVARPLGALVLGAYMDRKGRRAGLLLSLGLMAVGIVTIAVMPPYAIVGMAAPVLVIIGRLVQGFAVGGEGGGVGIYLAEIATPGHRGFYCAFTVVAASAAVVFSAAFGIGLVHVLTPGEMATWGWRVPLLVGCLAVPLLFWLRRSLAETDAFLAARPPATTGEVLRILVTQWRAIAIGATTYLFPISVFYFATAYTPTFAARALHLAPEGSLVVTLAIGLALSAFYLLGGALSDCIGRWPQVILCPAATIATAYPAIAWLAAEPGFARLFTVELWLAALDAFSVSALIPLLAETMPASIRTSGFAIAMSIATGLFGAFTPAVSTLLIGVSGDAAAPALWLSLTAAFSLAGALTARRLVGLGALGAGLTAPNPAQTSAGRLD
jgi:MFS transporter, MHS family, citrate/tricarballylate:H+ symporter